MTTDDITDELTEKFWAAEPLTMRLSQLLEDIGELDALTTYCAIAILRQSIINQTGIAEPISRVIDKFISEVWKQLPPKNAAATTGH